MKRGVTEFACPIAARTVKIALRHGGGLHEPERVYVRCDQRDCQYVDLNQPPCPLKVEMFADESDDRVADFLRARAGQPVCYPCVTTALGIDHAQARRVSWRLKHAAGVSIRPARCSECRARRVTIGLAALPASSEATPTPSSAQPAPDPSALERYLRRYPGYWFCVHCLARELATAPAAAREAVWALQPRPGFALRTAQCVSCLLTKRVIRFDETPAKSDPAARVIGLLLQHVDKPVCAACLAFASESGLAEVRRLLGDLEPLAEFRRDLDVCTVCSRWQPIVVARATETVDDEGAGELRTMAAGQVRHRGSRIDLLSFRTSEGWRPFALVKAASGALVPGAPTVLGTVCPTKVEADEQAAAQAREWIDRTFPS